MKIRLLLFAFLALSLNTQAAKLPPGFIEERIAQGLDPTTMAMAPDGRIFIAEKDGRIRIVENGVLLEDPFLEIAVDNFNERGLGGLAFHPNFEQNNWIYVTYTVPNQNHNRISRFTANGNYAPLQSEEILLDLPRLTGTIHNGGAMAFGADGKLYVAIGDGANAANSQDLNTLLGKFIRLNDDGSIPEDNPFANVLAGENRAIYAYGFRNPFTFAIQPGTGRIFANEVGNELYEEVNQIESGKNYGWDEIEGYYQGNNAPENYQDPFYSYHHDIGCAVIGAAFYNPEIVNFPPRYEGKYFFGDYCEGYIKVLDPETGEMMETFATDINRPIAMLVGPNGDLYYLDRPGIGNGSMQDNTSSSGASLWRVRYTGSGAPFVSDHPDDVLVSVGEPASFEIQSNGAAPLSYQWLRNGEEIIGATETTYRLENCQLGDDQVQFSCRISNEISSAISETAILRVTSNRRPAPEITSPPAGMNYRAGMSLVFAGQAADPEDGELGNSQLFWRIDFHHNDHTHPALTNLSGANQGEYLIPQVGETDDNVWYRIYLTAYDEEGLAQTVSRDIFPQKVSLNAQTQPAGLRLHVDGRTVEEAYTFQSVVGVQRTLRAPVSQERGGEIYVFKEWADGITTPYRSFAAPESPQSYTAIYEEIERGNGEGLLGSYFNDPEATFRTSPVFQRIDPTINFNWAASSPQEDRVDADLFTVRWSGYVEPFVSERYTFYPSTDDGVRLWVDDQLIIDQWVPQGITESSGSIELEKGKRYRIRMEYYEAYGLAAAELRWSSPRTPKQIIPSSQLYPDDLYAAQAGESVYFFPNPFGEQLSFRISDHRSTAYRVDIVDTQGRELWNRLIFHEPQQTDLEVPTANWAPGLYFVRVNVNNRTTVYKVVKR
ncbi:MAG TPA: PQQ-dependent sugar dehydrogenase [Saprospiraceae bacterium]|nr:PQQ-dependent sugar dehydrogenase [Saprospiraceae bacterium]